ncbi:MAG: hypothetical protein AAF223_18735, partial [Bacteroidota bacterium]
MFKVLEKYRWLLTTIGLSYISIVGLGQGVMIQSSEQLGDQYFLAEQYFRAGQYYQLAFKRDSSNYELILKLAHCERHRFNYKKAARWYQQAQNSSSQFSPEAAYYQSLMLKNLGRNGVHRTSRRAGGVGKHIEYIGGIHALRRCQPRLTPPCID